VPCHCPLRGNQKRISSYFPLCTHMSIDNKHSEQVLVSLEKNPDLRTLKPGPSNPQIRTFGPTNPDLRSRKA
jgi:hypothetical protein